MRILVVYEMIPEETKFYTIETENEATIELLKSVDRKIANTDDLSDEQEDVIYEWIQGNMKEGDGELVNFDLVLHTGFYM